MIDKSLIALKSAHIANHAHDYELNIKQIK
jgi:hypothetical protein